MKLVYCIDSLVPSGGTERVFTTKANWWAEHGHEVYVVTLHEDKAPFFALHPDVKRICVDADRYREELERVLREVRPQVAVAVAGRSFSALPKCKDGSVKVMEFHYTRNFLVNFVNGIPNLRLKRLHLLKMHYLQWRLRQQARRFDLFVGLTSRDVSLWGNPKNMTYVYNPLSFRSERKSDCRSKRIIGVGSWTPAKGFDQLLEAFGPLASRYPDWRVELYGAGQDEQRLRDIIAKYGMEAQVTLNSPVPNVGERMVEASICAFPSRSDGFGLVITEAMECGLPVVAMDCECGPREIVTPTTGIVVPDKDVQAFSKALERLITDETLRISMGEAASKEVARFYPDSIMTQWEALFSNLF